MVHVVDHRLVEVGELVGGDRQALAQGKPGEAATAAELQDRAAAHQGAVFEAPLGEAEGGLSRKILETDYKKLHFSF